MDIYAPLPPPLAVDFQFFILVLNSFKDLDSLMFGDIISHIFGPRYLMISVPQLTVLTLGISQHLLLIKLW